VITPLSLQPNRPAHRAGDSSIPALPVDRRPALLTAAPQCPPAAATAAPTTDPALANRDYPHNHRSLTTASPMPLAAVTAAPTAPALAAPAPPRQPPH